MWDNCIRNYLLVWNCQDYVLLANCLINNNR